MTQTFIVNSGTTSVSLNLPLLETAAGITLISANTDGEAFSSEFPLELIPKANIKGQSGESLNELASRKSSPHCSQHVSHNLYARRRYRFSQQSRPFDHPAFW